MEYIRNNNDTSFFEFLLFLDMIMKTTTVIHIKHFSLLGLYFPHDIKRLV